MTRDDVIRMAEEAGFSAYHLAVLDQGIYRFADSVAAREREACALACDKLGDEYADANAAHCAFAIRERGAP